MKNQPLSFWTLEDPECKSLHIASSTVAVATSHTTPQCLSSVPLSENGLQTITLNIKGENLNDDSTRIGFGVEGWQETNAFKVVLGTDQDSWGLASGTFYHNNTPYTGPGFPKFNPDHAQIQITFDREENKADFWLDGQNVNIIRDLPKGRFQILIYVQNASVHLQIESQSRNWTPSVLRFMNTNGESKENETEICHKKLVREIHEIKKDHKNINILLVGEPGNGKSSFINSIMSACAKDRRSLQDVIPFASVRDTTFMLEDEEKKEISSHTRKITSYRLPQSRIYLWDCFGISSKGSTRYLTNFSALMEGKLRPGYSKDEPGVDQQDFVLPSKHIKPHDRIHCVFVFIDGEKLMEDDDDIFDSPREFIDAAQHLYDDGLRVIVILTKVDRIGKHQFIDGILEENFNIRNVYKNPLIYEKILLIKRKLGVGINQIVPVQNYSSSEETEGLSYFKELFHLRAVTLAIKYAEIAMDNDSDSSDDDDDDDDED